MDQAIAEDVATRLLETAADLVSAANRVRRDAGLITPEPDE